MIFAERLVNELRKNYVYINRLHQQQGLKGQPAKSNFDICLLWQCTQSEHRTLATGFFEWIYYVYYMKFFEISLAISKCLLWNTIVVTVNSKVCKQSENAYKRDIYYKRTLNEKLVYNMNNCLKCTISDNVDKNMARYILLLLLLVLF